MNRIWGVLVATVVGVSMAGVGFSALGDNGEGTGERQFKAVLTGYSEVPAVSSTGKGMFRATLAVDGTSLTYELSYSGLEAMAFASHIHLGQGDVNGGVSAFLCGGGGKPACPESGSVTGTITAADVIGPTSQGIAAGELGELVAALQAGMTYTNVHTAKHPGGEIRGQIN